MTCCAVTVSRTQFPGEAEVDDLELVNAARRARHGRRGGDGGGGGPPLAALAPAAASAVALSAGGRRRRLDEDDVLRLQVEVKDPLRVYELHAAQDLPEEVPALGLRQLVVLGGYTLEELAALEVLRQQHALLLALKCVRVFVRTEMRIRLGNEKAAVAAATGGLGGGGATRINGARPIHVCAYEY